MATSEPQTNLTAKLGPVLFLLAILLSPLIGGSPAGEQFGADAALHALRFLMLLAAALTGIPSLLKGSWPARAAWLGLLLYGGSAVASLLLHSKGLTSQVFLWTMLPGTLDILTHIAACLIAAGLWLVPEQRQRIVDVIQIGASLAAGSILLEAISAQDAGHRSVGTFFSPNFAAGFIGAALPFVVVQLLGATTTPRRLTSLLSLAMLGAALVATGSRGGIALGVGGVILTLLVAFIRDGIRVPIKWVCVGLALFFIGAALQSKTILARTAGGASQEHSGAFRSETWKGTLAMAAANPVVGTGPGTFASKYGPYARVAWTGQAHSSYLQVASETGFPALLLWAGALLAGLGSAVRWLLRTERPHVAAGLCGGLAVVAARGLLDSETILLANLLPLAALLGLAAGGGVPASKWAWWSPLWAIPLGVAFVPLATTPSPGSDNAGWPPEPGRLAFRARFLEQQAIEAAGRGEDPSALRQQSRVALEDAARIEPVPRRYFARARFAEAEGDLAAAALWFGKALAAEPTALQTLHALATAQERLGDRAAAQATWERLLAVDAGPAGRIKAIPELQDMWSTHAEAALAREATSRGDKAEAMRRWENAREGIRAYTGMPPLYQAMELERVPAGTPGSQAERVISRRAELRGILGEIRVAGLEMSDLETALDTMDAEARRWAERTASAGSPP